VDHTQKPSGLDNRSPDRPDHQAALGRGIAYSSIRDWRSGFISRADVTDFLVKQIGDASLVHKAPVLTG
jgi:hypothetical protein